jgi:7-carboxy-7-deazaguanine synthase
LYLSEEFLSIQGEGKFSGTPSIFFRFGGCNFQCQGFGVSYFVENEERLGCDSYFSVDTSFVKEWKEIEQLSDLIAILEKYPKNINDIVITGGEPLIYSKNKLFLGFLRHLKSLEKRITIETNGTIEIEEKEEFQNLYFSISPKLSNSGEELKKNRIFSAINSYLQNSKNIFFKFTLSSGMHDEVHQFSKEFPEIQIYCMPLSQDKNELEENSRKVVDFAIKHNYIYSDRIHMRLWNNERNR